MRRRRDLPDREFPKDEPEPEKEKELEWELTVYLLGGGSSRSYYSMTLGTKEEALEIMGKFRGEEPIIELADTIIFRQSLVSIEIHPRQKR